MFLKRFARDTLYWSADATGRLRARESGMSAGLTTLTYHRVLPDAEARACPFPSLAMPLSWFQAQMEWLSRNARTTTLERALSEPDPGEPDSRPAMAVTFDDGYFDNFDYAAPVLRECGIPATFFICTAPVRNGTRFWYDSIAEGVLRWGAGGLQSRLAAHPGILAGASTPHGAVAALKRIPDRDRRSVVSDVERLLGDDRWIYRSHVMTVEQLKSLASSGHEIGSHTETHPILTQLDAGQAGAELRESKSWLETTTGRPVTGFCYPNGDHSPESRAWVRDAGYRYACLTEEGRHARGADPLRIPRIDMAPNRVSNCLGRWSERSFRATVSQLRRPGADPA